MNDFLSGCCGAPPLDEICPFTGTGICFECREHAVFGYYDEDGNFICEESEIKDE
jgi:hypothetical protein